MFGLTYKSVKPASKIILVLDSFYLMANTSVAIRTPTLQEQFHL